MGKTIARNCKITLEFDNGETYSYNTSLKAFKENTEVCQRK